MDTIITTGDFDFNIFATTPGPTIKEKVPVTAAKATTQQENNKRKADEVDTRPTPSWVRGGNRNNDSRSANNSTAGNEKGQFNNNNKRAKYTNPRENKEEDRSTNDTPTKYNNNNKNNAKDNNKNSKNDNKDGEPKFEQSNFKQAWEPDASDFQHVIAIEKTSDTMFTGDWDSLGLNKRVVSTITNNMKLPQPTHIQNAAIPQILEGHDVLVKAETGSGKTLTYVLPVLHALGNIEPHINRKDGAYAIMIAPTRELVSQIYEVVCQVAKTWIWVVPGYLSGGENKDTEKTRLRKGVNVLVSTPGRLIDHLTTTACFKFDKLKFLVLDEADRLLDLGFGPKIAEIVGILERPRNDNTNNNYNNNNNNKNNSYGKQWGNKTNNSNNNNNFGKNDTPPEETEESKEKKEDEKPKEKANKAVKFTYDDEDELEKPSNKKYQTILASATLHNGVRQLAALTLKEPYYIGLKPQAVNQSTKHARVDIETGQEYNTPANLLQYYCITKTKERLSSLVTLLQQCAKNKQKVVVFVASCDIVDYYYVLLTGVNADPSSLERKPRHGKDGDEDDEEEKASSEEEDEKEQEKEGEEEKEEDGEEGEKKPHVPLIEAPIYKLHGDLSQVERNNAYSRFRKDEAAILISTDVSARGLDFPDVHWIVQYDPPADTKDYIHRVGRTARMGREGSSLLYLIPEEEGYVPYLKNLGLVMESRTVPPSHTTQLLIERFVEDNKTAFKLARAAYVSSVRAYSTHTAATKHIFSLSNLHVGHLAKAYGLRDRPSELSGALKNQMKGKKKAQVVEKKIQQTKRIFRAPPVERAAASEFDAGLE